MPTKQSAGILLYRLKDEAVEVFLVHPGGPFWKNKDVGAWSVPKGEFTDAENALDAARREFIEETGIALHGDFIELQPIKQKGGKVVYAWAIEGDIDETKIISNTFGIEWPPRSGTLQQFPEVDKANWFAIDLAKEKINPSQSSLLEQLLELLNLNPDV